MQRPARTISKWWMKANEIGSLRRIMEGCVFGELEGAGIWREGQR